MSYTPAQRKMATTAAMLGYKISENFGEPIEEFKPGDGVIVVTNKGEPVNSGIVKAIEMPNNETGFSGRIVVGEDNTEYALGDHFLRRL